MEFDKDLLSVQHTRDLIRKAKAAQNAFSPFTQKETDRVVKAVADHVSTYASKLAKMAVEETGFGVAEDKMIKNYFASISVWESIKGMKTRGIIRTGREEGIWEVAAAVGVVAGLIPSTNPTSTVIYKALIALKGGNAIVFSPHPAAISCITQTVDIIRESLERNGAPKDLVSVLPIPTMDATRELMRNDQVSFILATGGKDMVKAAYSSGTPAWGVGPGNVPAYIEKTADIKKAVSHIIESKTFDNGVICASEQAIVTEDCIKDRIIHELRQQGCYFLDEKEKLLLEKIIQRPNGSLNPGIVGKSAVELGAMAGIHIPPGIKILIAHERYVGPDYPFSMEKLSPLLAFYVEKDWENACEKCIQLLEYGGIGHSLSIHTENEEVLKEFALRKPVSRLLVNTSSTHGGIGATTNIPPALTLGCGAVGGSATSENITPLHLINIRKIAFGVREYEHIKQQALDAVKNVYQSPAHPAPPDGIPAPFPEVKQLPAGVQPSDEALVESIVEKVLQSLQFMG